MDRIPTTVDGIADAYLTEASALNPLAATYLGIAGYDDKMPDLSPDGLAAVSQLRQRTLSALASAAPIDANDRITVAALTEEHSVAEQIRATGHEEARLNNLESPLQAVRDVFDLMPDANADDWAVITARLAAVPAALEGYIASLRFALGRGDVVPQRQIDAGIVQCGKNSGPDGFFAMFAASAPDLPAALTSDLARASTAAADAYVELASVLRNELMPAASAVDPVGAERYALFSRSFLGTAIDLAETYEWGQAELARLVAEISEVGSRIVAGASTAEVIAHLNTDPARMLQGTDALQAWMQDKSDAAVAALGETHFDIPAPIRTLECRIAPTSNGGIYYTGPSEDFSRPGRMWWSVPPGVTEFSTWNQLTIVYHEGVPGHHLQVAQTSYRRELLNRWRRLASWVSGHGEGWALYAERLMADLGYLSDPGDYLGMLLAQSMRAARVVIDIGVHCGFEAPPSVGGGPWDYDKAWQLLTAHSVQAEPVLRFELDRYLGWPGQAPSYKIGERFWLQLREDARTAAGADFELTAFHRQALDIGSVGLDVLRGAVLGTL